MTSLRMETGLLVEWDDNPEVAARRVAEALRRGARMMRGPESEAIRRRMFESAYSRFNEAVVAARYLSLINKGGE